MEHILIVDDSATARMFIRKCLEIAGCQQQEYFEAPNGEAAFALLQQTPMDLVVTDLNMPVMDGHELLKKLRSSETLSALPVLVITSIQNRSKQEELQAFNVTQVLAKPVSPAKILDALKALGLKGRVQ